MKKILFLVLFSLFVLQDVISQENIKLGESDFNLYLPPLESLEFDKDDYLNEDLADFFFLKPKRSSRRVKGHFYSRRKGYSRKKLKPKTAKEYTMAIKTNILYDAIITPNIELEFPITGNMSIVSDYFFAWYLKKNNLQAYQVYSGSLEYRYWFADRSLIDREELFTGFFAAPYLRGGYYDLQHIVSPNNELDRYSGYQGGFFSFGATGGYGLSLSKYFRAEFSLSLGYLYSKYAQYEPYYGVLVRRNDKKVHYFGPTSIKASIVYVLNFKRDIKMEGRWGRR